MKLSTPLFKCLLPAIALCVPLFWATTSVAASCTSGSSCVTVGNGVEDPLTKEQARQEKQHWDETKSLRSKITSRTEKEFNKLEQAIDNEDTCRKSLNRNAYWEPNTQRCLDTNTGYPIKP